jgi:hypothetical protein
LLQQTKIVLQEAAEEAEYIVKRTALLPLLPPVNISKKIVFFCFGCGQGPRWVLFLQLGEVLPNF